MEQVEVRVVLASNALQENETPGKEGKEGRDRELELEEELVEVGRNFGQGFVSVCDVIVEESCRED